MYIIFGDDEPYEEKINKETQIGSTKDLTNMLTFKQKAREDEAMNGSWI